jgi:hypothetical protein
MLRFKHILLVALFLLPMVVQNANAQIFGVQVDPALQWQTLTTEHFRIHFHQGLEDVSYEVANIAEEAYSILSKEFGQAPKTLDLVLIDSFDFSNGSSNPIYGEVILIPSGTRLSDWANVRLDSWWRMLIFHELVHAIELDMTQGVPQILRNIFGKISVPNLIKPIPFIEGLAVYEKYKNLGESRFNDSHTRMILRQMVLDNNIPSFDEIKQYYSRRDWPTNGFLVYNFGSWLMDYIEETYGNDALARFDRVNSGNLMNVFFFSDLNETIKKAFNVSADDLYTGFRAWLKDQFSGEIIELQQEALTAPIQITSLGYTTGEPSWSPDGKWIAYTHSDPGRSDLRMVTPKGEEDHEITTGALISHPSWAPNNLSLVYTKIDYDSPYYLHSDLYRYHLDTQTEERLTTGSRAFFARFTPDGKGIVFAQDVDRDGSTALSHLDLQTHEIQVIKKFPDGNGIIHSFSFSPDESKIAIALLVRGGYQDIYIMAATGGDLIPVTQDKNQDMDPAWTPDGQYLLFSSDADRVYNLYAYQVSTNSFFKVTNMMTGAFTPTISPKGDELAFTSYRSKGYDIYQMPLDSSKWKPATLPRDTVPAWSGYAPHTQVYQPYNALAYLMPKGWFPVPSQTGVGVLAFGADPLYRFIYSGVAGWDFKANLPTYNLSLQLNPGFPINIALSQAPEGLRQSISFSVPLALSLTGGQSLMLGYERSNLKPQDDNDKDDKKDEDPSDSANTAIPLTQTLHLQYLFNHVRHDDLFAESMNITTGLDLWNREGSNQWFKRLTLDWHEEFRLPFLDLNTLNTHLKAGWTDGAKTTEKFELGGNSSSFSLRGFDKKSFSGKQAVLGSFEWASSVISIKETLAQWPIFINELGINLFTAAGMAGDQLNLKEIHVGFGAELTLSTTVSYFAQLQWVFGVAQGLGQPAPKFYFNVSIPGLL